MTKESELQPWLSEEFSALPTVERVRTRPRPHPEKFPTTLAELLGTAFNLKHKGEIRKWLGYVQKEHNFKIDEVLPARPCQLVNSYFRSPWPTREEVAAQVFGDPGVEIKRRLKIALIRIWRRSVVGPRAIEILKPEFYLYKSMARYGVTTIDELDEIRDMPLDVAIICGYRRAFEELKVKMQKYFLDWNPAVLFPLELEPAEALVPAEKMKLRAKEMREKVKTSSCPGPSK